MCKSMCKSVRQCFVTCPLNTSNAIEVFIERELERMTRGYGCLTSLSLGDRNLHFSSGQNLGAKVTISNIYSYSNVL